MKTVRKFIWIVLLGMVSGPYAQRASTEANHGDIRIVSSFVAAGEPVPAECAAQAHVFAESLIRYPRPTPWHWVLLCDEAGWRRFLRLSGRGERDPIYASTDVEGRTTYLRAAKLLQPDDFGVEMDAVVAHELAHIWLRGGDEATTARLGDLWRQRLSAPKPGKIAPENAGN